MTDLRKIVAAIERQKPEILQGWRMAVHSESLRNEGGGYFAFASEYATRPLLLGLLSQWAVNKRCGGVVGNELRVGHYTASRSDIRGVFVTDDLLAAWAWVCGIEVEDE